MQPRSAAKNPGFQAVVLVGGIGSRLRSVISDVPKPMAPIANKPFLAYLLTYLKKQGIRNVIFPMHHLSEKITSFFHDHYAGIDIQYIYEEELLGTGGAIVNALSKVPDLNQPLFVLNGDTFIKLDYQAMHAQHKNSHAQITMALRHVPDCMRYGKVITENNRVIAFKEKGEQGRGLINAGVYLINPNLFSSFNLPAKFSIEQDFIQMYLKQLEPQAFVTDEYFIDIGIPEDYARAIKELPMLEKTL